MHFLVFEGLDGSGKSSLMKSLENELSHRGIAFLRTREPGGTKLGDEIRDMILRPSDFAPKARTELLLYEASRAQHIDEVIAPALKHGQWVLCDRFTASSVAFQAGGRQISEEWVHRLNEFATNGLKPELTILLDLSVEESRRRRRQREVGSGVTEDRIESEADHFHERVRQAFIRQAKEDASSWLVLDASNSPETLLERLIDHLKVRKWLE